MIPPRTILAAVSFSDTSRVALGLAARLARHCGAALHVVHAEDPLLDAAADQAGFDLARETHAELRRFIADAWPAARCSPRPHVRAGAAVDVILDVAHEEGADLVVVGNRGMSGVERLVFGSTTDRLMRRAEVSLLVAPAEWLAPHPDTLDLSGLRLLVAPVELLNDSSVAAAKAACALASVLGTAVEIVHVVPGPADSSHWRAQTEMAARDRDRITAAQQELELVIRKLGSSVPVEVRVGAVSNWLADAAGPASGRAPILVMGRKAPGTKGAALGTMAYRVLSAAVPVLMHVADQIASL